MSDQSITLVLPTKNEAEGVAMVIDSVKPYVTEVLVIDGNSTDGTPDIARKCGARVLTEERKGKGSAIQLAVREAYHNVIVFMDADGSHDPDDILKLAQPIFDDQADMVIGSRIRGGSDELHGDFSNFFRSIGGGIITICINYRWNVRITDSLNGFRAIRKDVAVKLELKARDFDIEQHMVCRCLQRHFRVAEIPSHESVRKWGVSKLPTFKKGYLFMSRLAMDLMGF